MPSFYWHCSTPYIELHIPIPFNTVFVWKQSAICAQAVYFLHSTMPSVMCLQLSDVSVICHVNYFQFPVQSVFLPCRSTRQHSGPTMFSSMSVNQAAQWSNNVLRVLQISSKLVHFQRSYSWTCQHHQILPLSESNIRWKPSFQLNNKLINKNFSTINFVIAGA